MNANLSAADKLRTAMVPHVIDELIGRRVRVLEVFRPGSFGGLRVSTQDMTGDSFHGTVLGLSYYYEWKEPAVSVWGEWDCSPPLSHRSRLVYVPLHMIRSDEKGDKL